MKGNEHTIQVPPREEEKDPESFLTSALDSLNHPFYVVDTGDYSIVMANSAARASGIVPGSKCYGVSHGFDRPCEGVEHTCPLRGIKDKRESVVVEHIHQGPEGEPRTFEIHCHPILDSEGNVVRMIEYTLDITERRRAEEALAQKNAVDEALLNLSRSLLVTQPLEEMCRLVLDCARTLTGSPFGFVGHISPESGNLVCPAVTRDIMDGGEISEGSAVFTKFGGMWGWVLENRRPLLSNTPWDDPRSSGIPEGHQVISRFLAVPASSGGLPQGIIAMANAGRDYTSEDQALLERLAAIYAFALNREQDRKALQEAKEQLEDRVVERTAQLSEAMRRVEAELQERRKQETLAAVGGMAAGIAHEVKNPLFAITSGIQLLKRELKLEGEQSETLEILLQNTMRMDRLISQLRALGARSKPHRLPVYPVELVQETLTLNRGLLQEKGIHVKASFEDIVPPVLADRDQLRQVLLNLLQNAITASPTGSTLDISAGIAKGGGALHIRVRDRGLGIQEDLLERIFEPFFSTKRESSGIGLAITRKILLEHGASIWAENAEGGGAAFTVSFPLGVSP